MKAFEVTATTPKQHQKRVVVRGETGQISAILLHRYALVKKGDSILLNPEHPSNIFIPSSEEGDKPIRISPIFRGEKTVRFGSQKIPARIQEVSTLQDLGSLEYLEKYHYKTFSDAGVEDINSRKASSAGGRKSVLMLYLKIGRKWQEAGYIELHMPLMMVKPRHTLFDAHFSHSSRDISWESWDQHSIRKYVNLIVRIARVVVAPDFRGMGLARLLIDYAKSFCEERWHIGGRRPLFIEISAEMLSYINFVASSGFRYVGKTEGNIKRVVKDLESMRRGQKTEFGIMTLQKKYLNYFNEYCANYGKDHDQVLNRLSRIAESREPEHEMWPEEWMGLRRIFRFPIPYYLFPLDEDSEEFIDSRPKDKEKASQAFFRIEEVRVGFQGLKASLKYSIPGNKYTRMVMDAFGLRGNQLEQSITGPINIEASGGNIIFVAGSSGSGKSVLLRALDPNCRSQDGFLVSAVSENQNYSAGWLDPLPLGVSIFEYFAKRYSSERAFSALSQVGLSEALIFLKPFSMLSRGQKYRAMLADLLLRDEAVWLVDEFCADLDPLSAKIVAHNLRRQVVRTRRICFVAAANHSHFIDALKPSKVLVLRAGAKATTLTFKEYKDDFLEAAV